MNKTLTVSGYFVTVTFKERSVHIDNNKQLWEMLNADRLPHTRMLAELIHETFILTNGRPLEITADSLMVEIWAHVYLDYFTKSAERWLPVKLMEALADRVNEFCDIIDCGEAGNDNNRFFWDILAGQAVTINRLLPDSIDTERMN